MTEQKERALRDAVASSAMEGIVMSEELIQIVRDLADHKLTVQEYLRRLRQKYAAE